MWFARSYSAPMNVVVGVLLVLAVVCASKDSVLESFGNFVYGQLNNSALHLIAGGLPEGRLHSSIAWLADHCILFSFPAYDGLILQGYFIPGDLVSQSGSDSESRESPVIIRPVVLSSGWSESTIRNAPALRELNSLGHDIFAFDMRGQGFSDSSLYDKQTGRKISHITSLNQLVDDLELFISKVVPEHFHRITNNRYADASQYQLVPSYIGFSFSGLVGKFCVLFYSTSRYLIL